MLSDYRTKFGLVLLVVSILLISWICYPADVGHSQTASSDSTSLTVVNHSITMKSDGKHITGQIKNISNRTFSNVKVLTSFYDQNNRFLGSGDFTYLEPSTINRGETGKFDLMISPSSQELGAAKLYTLTFVWQNQNGSSSYFVANSQAKKPEPPLEQKTSDAFAKKDDTIKSKESSNQKLLMRYLGTIGSEGSNEGKLYHPASIEYASSNNRIYVSDLDNNRIQIFDAQGRFISSWGSAGVGAGEFNNPGDIAADLSDNNVYVSDIGNNRIQKFDTNGGFMTEWGTSGEGSGQFDHPGDIAIDASKKFLYVTDVNNNRVQKFDSNGNFLTQWGSKGVRDGQFINPTGITIDQTGMVYVADTGNDRIQKFDGNGKLIKKWGSSGKSSMQFESPDGITFDSETGLLYVSDRGNRRIMISSEDGSPVYQLDLKVLTNGLNIKPRDVAIDNVGKLFVVDKVNSKIHVFTSGASQK